MHVDESAVKTLAGAFAVLLVGTYAWLLANAMMFGTYNHWGSLLLVPVIVLLTLPFIATAARHRGERWFAILLPTAFFLKLLASAVRYYVAYVVYTGVADAETYNLYAAYQSREWRRGFFTWDFPDTPVTGTTFIKLLTTGVYTATGPSPILGFFLFSLGAFWGTYFMFRAFCIAVPDGDHKRYAYLIFLLPSMLYWPSSIGKEAWLMFTIGLTVLGLAKMYAGQHSGLLLLVGGLLLTSMVRPHFSAMIVAAAFAAIALRDARGQRGGALGKLLAILFLVGVGALVINQSAAFLGVDTITPESVSAAINESAGQTVGGGSEFTPFPIRSPLDVIPATVTVLFRPFVWEAHNPQVVVTAVEGMFMLLLLLASWRRLRAVPSMLRKVPYVTFSLVYTALFVFAFSGFANFGILARQRSLILPFLLVLLALPAVEAKGHRRHVRKPLVRAG